MSVRIMKQQAQEILERLSFLPFEDCLPMSRCFRQFPELPRIYAIRHQTEGLLYLGKTNNLNTKSQLSDFFKTTPNQ